MRTGSRTPRRTPAAAAGLAVVAVCTAGACGGGSDEAAPAATVTVTAESAPSAESTSPAPDAIVSPSDEASAAPSPTASSATPTASSIPASYTKEDTHLKLGQMATVPYTLRKVTGPIGVTVTRIDKGRPADLAVLKLGDKVKGFTPYYVRITVTNVAGGPFAYSSLSSTSGVLADGSEAQGVIAFGRFDPCDSESAGRDFDSRGATYETCTIGLAGPGTAVVGAQYDSSYSGGDNPPPNTEYGRNPIVWR